MNKKLKILIYEPYPFGQISGNLRCQSYVMKFIDREKCDLLVVSPFESEFTEYVLKKDHGLVILKPPSRLGRYGKKNLKDSIYGKLLTLFDILKYNVSLYKLLKKEKVDALYCNGMRALLTCFISAKLARVPILLFVKSELQTKYIDPIGFFVADRILFFCEQNKNDKYPFLVKLFNEKIGILKIGMDIDEIEEVLKKDKTELKKELCINDKDVNIIYLGQIYSPKGVHFLLEAMGTLLPNYPELKLYVVGHHVLEEYAGYQLELEEIVDKYKMKDRVIFTGWRTDSLEIVSLMDIMIHPSLKEGFGRSVLEAMAMGKMVIASAVGGLREAVHDGENGYLVKPGDSKGIAEKLKHALDNKEIIKKYGEKAKETVYSEYIAEEYISGWQCEIEKMVNRK
ncbi:MAG: glycosyltransferase [Nitrospinota bacterium]|nr:glycosyltransferase [Nitrospinota bacterium]